MDDVAGEFFARAQVNDAKFLTLVDFCLEGDQSAVRIDDQSDGLFRERSALGRLTHDNQRDAEENSLATTQIAYLARLSVGRLLGNSSHSKDIVRKGTKV